MPDQVTTKVCSKCKVEKLMAFFNKQKSVKDGFSNECRACANISSKAWALANPEKIKAIKKAWAAKYTDLYVANLIGLKFYQCPQELIELKRINLQITREIRNQQQCQN